ncbi:MAG: hypothetical protein HY721_08000, partial [Planctomycetes bacterium]|nr:hypothetical protein [Planctomycetota bacterium]
PAPVPAVPAAAPTAAAEAPPASGAAPDHLDVGARIRKRARVVRASDLASRLKTVQVLNLETIRGLIREAVEDSAVLVGASLKEAERKRLLEEAEASFAERLEMFRSEKAGLEEKSRLLQEQLGKAQALLEEERQRVVSASQFTVSSAGMVELEQKLGRLLDRALRAGKASADLERDMREVVRRLLDDEREKIRAQAEQAQSDAIALLERKVSRLASSLEHAEEERRRAEERAHALEAAGGIAFRGVMTPGLDEGDPQRERKLSLLKEIFQFNQEVRRELAAAGRLPQRERAPAAEEGEIARELGILRAAPEAAEAPKAPEPLEAGAEGTSTAVRPASGGSSVEMADTSLIQVPALALGEDCDPDDSPWDPAGDLVASEAERGRVRNLGRD